MNNALLITWSASQDMYINSHSDSDGFCPGNYGQLPKTRSLTHSNKRPTGH